MLFSTTPGLKGKFDIPEPKGMSWVPIFSKSFAGVIKCSATSGTETKGPQEVSEDEFNRRVEKLKNHLKKMSKDPLYRYADNFRLQILADVKLHEKILEKKKQDTFLVGGPVTAIGFSRMQTIKAVFDRDLSLERGGAEQFAELIKVVEDSLGSSKKFRGTIQHTLLQAKAQLLTGNVNEEAADDSEDEQEQELKP